MIYWVPGAILTVRTCKQRNRERPPLTLTLTMSLRTRYRSSRCRDASRSGKVDGAIVEKSKRNRETPQICYAYDGHDAQWDAGHARIYLRRLSSSQYGGGYVGECESLSPLTARGCNAMETRRVSTATWPRAFYFFCSRGPLWPFRHRLRCICFDGPGRAQTAINSRRSSSFPSFSLFNSAIIPPLPLYSPS